MNWYVDVEGNINFNVNNLYIRRITADDVRTKTLKKWLTYLDKKIWFVDKLGFIFAYNEWTNMQEKDNAT